MNSSTEILKLNAASSTTPESSYAPVWIVTDRRETDPNKTTLKYAQIGGPKATDKIGNAHGPIYMIEFVLIPSSPTHIRVWGIDNDDQNAPIYPVEYLRKNPKLNIWLSKFEFTDENGLVSSSGGDYIIYGHRKRQYPAIF